MARFTRDFPHAYAAGDPRTGITQPVGHVIAHEPTARNPSPGVTPVSSAYAPAWSTEGAPYYNSGYVYPQYAALQTGGFMSLQLPPQAAMIDLTDTTTWDRPVWFLDAR